MGPPGRPTVAPTRRTFLAGAAVLAGAGAVALAGCGSPSSLPAPDLSAGRDGRVRVDNAAGAIDAGPDGTIARFRAASQIEVTYDEKYADPVAMAQSGPLAGIQPAAWHGYDLIVPSYWVAQRLLAKDLVQALPVERVPNHANLVPELLTLPWDRGSRSTLPWQSEFTVIAWNPAEVNGRTIRSIDQLLHDPSIKGKVGLVDDLRMVVGAVMLGKGQDPSRPTVEQANAALDDLETVLKANQVRSFAGGGGGQPEQLADRRLTACLATSRAVARGRGSSGALEVVVPNEGGMRSFTTMVIPVGASNPRGAADLMDFVYTPANAARITSSLLGVSPVIGAREELRKLGGGAPALADDPLLFPDDETRRRLFVWPGIGEAHETKLQARYDAMVAPLFAR